MKSKTFPFNCQGDNNTYYHDGGFGLSFSKLNFTAELDILPTLDR
jgi:hypothetical protein